LQRLEDLKRASSLSSFMERTGKRIASILFPVFFEVQNPASPSFDLSNAQADAWPVFWRNTGKKIETIFFPVFSESRLQKTPWFG